MGYNPVVFINKTVHNDLWIPRRVEVSLEFFGKHRRLSYMLPIQDDFLNLRKIFNDYRCDFVHAHNLWCAYYSYKLGLPTLFDDWEYYLEFLKYVPLISNGQRARGLPFVWYRRLKAAGYVKELIKNVVVGCTNKYVQEKYVGLDAKHCFVIPNVPLKFERDYAFAEDVTKQSKLSTCYIGSIKTDKCRLRNTKGVINFWLKHKELGTLYIFEGVNRVGHLELLRKLRSFHFNLLFWNPLTVHKYYLQNKAFLAAALGIPTIITSSLKATIDLLGDFALIVDCLNDIPTVIKYAKFVGLRQEHLWECYENNISKAYKMVCG